MADDPLYAPLGLKPAGARRGKRRVAGILAGVALVVVGAGLGVAYLDWRRQLPDRDVRPSDPVVVAEIPAAPPRPDPVPRRPEPAPQPLPPVATPHLFAPDLVTAPPGSTVEVQNGVKIVRLNPAASSAPVTVPVDAGPGVPLARAPDPRVSEPVPEGVLPRIGKDGIRPSIVYARPTPPVDGPSVALVALGAGRDQLGTAEAARRLPPAIDFALPPDAPDARTQVEEVRRGGREVVLDLGNDAAPDPRALRSAMAAWAGYVGLSLPAGADDAARQARERGLIALVPGGDNLLATDATDAAALVAMVTRLAGIARAKGFAIGLVENAIAGRDALAEAAARLSAQGVALVPLSAVSPKPAATAAAR